MKFLVAPSVGGKMNSGCGIQSGFSKCGIQSGFSTCGIQSGRTLSTCGIQTGRA